MIDWKKYQDAVQVTVNYLDASGDTINIDVFAPPTQPKTVADAVEWNEKVFKSKEWKNSKCDYIVHYSDSFSYSSSKNSGVLVCTRAEFEAYVKKQEGEKWTHTLLGDKARIKIDEPDCHGYVLIVTEGNGYNLARPDELKPIKPTLSQDAKRQLELYVQYRVDKYGDYDMKSDLSNYLSHHGII